ncbi:MFS transporter [Streptomyces sp. NPDC056161]|uniref:MFS transporter n=1 Tax=Streptomyces sp. NPDC056161 TaxID=3345732 RepID=UPI0035E0862C
MSSPPASPGLSRRRRQLVLAICCLSLFIVSLDNTVLQIALPTLQRDLRAPLSGLQWTIDAYTLVLASLYILAGSLADRIGRRRVFMTGLVVFTAGSALCSLAPTLHTLVAFRMLQAVGGSMLTPVGMSLVTHVFPDRHERAHAIGVWGAVVGLSMAVGPLIGGFLVDSAGWHSIFWLNLPVGLAALVLTRVFVPESRASVARRPDPVGQILVIALLGTLTYTIIQAPDHGWASATTLTLAGLTLALCAALAGYELRRDEPLIELRLFKSVPFTGAAINLLIGFGTLGGFLFLTTLYLQNVRHLSALHAGSWLLPMALMTFLCAPVSGRFVARYGARPPLLVAGSGITGSGIVFAAFDGQAQTWSMILGCALFGLGFGFVNAPTTNTAVAGLPVSQAGVASSLASTFRQTGTALGVAVIGAVLASGIRPDDYPGSYPDAAHPALWIITGCGLTILLVGQLTNTRRTPHPAHDTRSVSRNRCEGRTADGAATAPVGIRRVPSDERRR